MFNQLTPAEMVSGIGRVLRTAARREGQASDFDRDQLLSAYSASRHLAVELASYDDELRWFTAELTRLGLPGFAGELDSDTVGDAVCDLLAELAAKDSDEARRLRDGVHALLRQLADREVDLLAGGLT